VKWPALLDIPPNHHIWTNTSKEWALRLALGVNGASRFPSWPINI
jgi:hypothetical protein